MSGAIDSFSVTLKIHSFQCDPSEITCALRITPIATIRKDQDMGSRGAGRSFWAGTLSQGIGNDAFGDCLENLLVFMEQHKSFIETLQSGGGEATVELAQTIAINDGVVFQLKLDPIFLHKCGLHNIHLEVKAWTSEADFAPLSEQQNESIEMQCL